MLMMRYRDEGGLMEHAGEENRLGNANNYFDGV